MELKFGPRRARYTNIADHPGLLSPLSEQELTRFEAFDMVYRALCAMMYNYVPLSGHPGGSVSSGRIVASLLFDAMDYDMTDPPRLDADMISYGAGHKAMGLYGMWALRNEAARISAPELLPKDIRWQLRLEDLLGFRRNPVTRCPLFVKFRSKALDGHPCPIVPFIRLSTGASGVGDASSVGLGFGAMDYYGREHAPWLHIIEGEGGLTPGRVSEAMASAATSSLGNIVMHLDWNQAAIDSNAVCRDGQTPGDYVQWDPCEFAYLHDWNVVFVPDGFDFQQIIAAQRYAAKLGNGQPTCIVYRTVKGWRYGVEGMASHGGGHKLCSGEFFGTIAELQKAAGCELTRDVPSASGKTPQEFADLIEAHYWDALGVVRTAMEKDTALTAMLAGRLRASRERLASLGRRPRAGAPDVGAIYRAAAAGPAAVPVECRLEPGKTTTLRGELGSVLSYYNKQSHGALLASAADLYGSTSIKSVNDGFDGGLFNAKTNPGSRLLSTGGICEDGMCGILSGVSAFGAHLGAGSSYGAFIAALGHISARLHAIGNQTRSEIDGGPNRPFFIVCGHAGLKTGEDGPTHADPQPLQLLQENFVLGHCVTLTPWDPQELWPLVTAALQARPSVIAPFVTRPNEPVYDREALGLAPASASAKGVYLLREAKGEGDGTIVIQGSGVCNEFVGVALPRLIEEGIDLNVYYVASAELFDLLPEAERRAIFPEERAREAIGITGFTLPTMFRWILSERGRALTLYPFKGGRYLGSGKAEMVLAEAKLDGESILASVRGWVKEGMPQAV
jgi:transketolase